MGAPLWIAQACNKMQGQFTSAANSIAQKATITALKEGSRYRDEMKETFLKRRDLMLELLKDITGMKTNTPQGAFYIFPDISAYFGRSHNGNTINNSADLCMYLLTEGHVGLVPGEAFGEPNCLRISYAASDEELRTAVDRVKNALGELK